MARKIRSRIRISGTLVAQSPIHIGGVGGDPTIDLALAVNGRGDYYIPGTSLAGVFRAWMEQQTAEQAVVDRLWGTREVNDRSGNASFILVEDAVIDGDVQAEIRDGVGLDRFTGSAAEHIKYDRMILPKGTQIQFRMVLERSFNLSEQIWETVKSLYGGLIQTMEAGNLRLGAAKTRGLGHVKLQDTSIQHQDLCTPAGILAALTTQGDKVKLADLFPSIEHQLPLTLEIAWRPIGPLMVKAEQDGIAVDMLPLVSAVGDSLALVIPGSSIKGALRSQAERIVRTVLSQSTATQADSKQQFLKQLQIPLVEDLFGAAAMLTTGQGQIGALSAEDCYAKQDMTLQQWQAVTSAMDSTNLRQALNQANLTSTQQAFHVAVDRWTGGAAEGYLYSTLEPMGIEWQPIQLQVDLGRLKELRLAGVMLLLLLVRDLTQSRIALGYGANRGMGAIEVEKITISGNRLEDDLVELPKIDLQSGQLTLAPSLQQRLEAAWTGWIEQNQAQGVMS